MVPAWLGCVRLPQILYRSPDKAVDLIRTGRAVHAEEALALGFFGAIVTPEALLDAAVRRAEELAADREIWPEYLEIDRLPTARSFGPRHTRLSSLADRLVVEFFREYGGRPLEEAVAAETEMMMACVRSGSQLLRLVAGIFG
jgi:enoyl-CoA hydratase/carnithine racemase